MGRYGQKTRAGWYLYDDQRRQLADPGVAQPRARLGREKGIEQREISPQEIVDRCIYALVNEGARILEEGFALRAVDIDIIYLYGYGFPAHRGGPMWYADSRRSEKSLRARAVSSTSPRRKLVPGTTLKRWRSREKLC